MKSVELASSVFWGVILVLLTTFGSSYAALRVDHLKCEYKTNPVGIDVDHPRLSWQIQADRKAVTQSAYEIRVAATQKDVIVGKNLMWNTGRVKSNQSIQVVYEGPALESRRRVYWQVRIWDNKNIKSEWSEPAYWEAGLLKKNDWKADWISADVQEDVNVSSPAHMLRKTFTVKGQVENARLYITSLGLYQAEINGKTVGDEVLTPGWTAYQDHVQYQTYDVSFLLKTGANTLAVTLGDGWYRGFIGFQGQRNVYGEKLALLCQLEVTTADGRREMILSDTGWRAATGPILLSDIYDGETYDARLEKTGWNQAGYDDSSWSGVVVTASPSAKIMAPAGPPVRRIEEIRPIKIINTPRGERVIDMGQNMVGWVRFRVQGAKGTTVVLRHAEVLDKEGNFYTENLRAAKQIVHYTLKGGGIETFEPHFTFQGFRYVAVEGWPGTLSLDAFTGVVVHSEIAPSGTFECSNDLINQLQHNIRWGQKGNFVDVPTDCPQRDERLGWTGDAQVFARTACFNHDVAAFYTKWMKDFVADQQKEGQIPFVIPDVLSVRSGRQGNSGSAGWADAAVIIPWTMYLNYGDVQILKDQYDCMKGWVDYMAARAGESVFWNTDFTFGDWLAFATTRSDYPGATTDKDLLCQAYFARSTDLLQRMAVILGKTEDAEHYAQLLARIKQVFQQEFLTANGRLSSNTQTAYALALAFDLLPADLRPNAAERLAQDVNQFKHLTTGFLGTPVLCFALSENGYYDEAFMLLNRQQYPSWLYPITKGATTIWERWDGLKPDGSFQDAGMNSFNHYAYGAIGEWLYRVVAGIEIDEKNPAYKHTFIQPHPGGGLTYAKAEYQSMYGNIMSAWELNHSTLKVTVEIPVNTSATIKLPGAKIETVTVDGKPPAKVKEIISTAQDQADAVIRVGSGKYEFKCSID
ncbi:MAG: alpha-L-rhamnosidase [Calditrichaeota bacterium]|nr:MAG: alpha-L-rhamnosidase [Calditrichota bacterium]